MVQVPGLSSEHQLLAHCYAAEALCNLQSPQQAAQQLHTAVTLQSFSDRRQAELPVAEAEADADAAPQVCDCICRFRCLFNHLFVYCFVCLIAQLSMHAAICSCMHAFDILMHTLLHSSIHRFTCLFVCSSMHARIHEFRTSCLR